ncbi:ankyrin [Rhizodiscina lignyota]|uniref:Ankyrin n=1 Tax=Rhizodiscina lignyota TaxID=1504668 RepID=A0A9P4IF78_9PEZI|nr:ankyrin [Rhizodiscina lignyota]
MAPRKGKESLLDLCNKATILGNSISVRMLEYLSTAKNHPHGFRELATDFLDISRILWSIEAGLTEASRQKNQFPVEMINELDRKFRDTNDVMIVLNQMLLKFIDYERKGTFGRLQKGWRMMFIDSDIDKMRESLGKCRDALRMSAMVFRWSLGDAKADASVGIGYTGLVAALERMNQDRPTTVIPPLQHHIQETSEFPPRLPPVSLVERNSASNLAPTTDDVLTPSHASDRQMRYRAPSTRSSELTTRSNRRESVYRPPEIIESSSGGEDSSDDTGTESKTLIEERMNDIDLNSKSPIQVIHLKADPTTVPRWTPRGNGGTQSAGSAKSLLEAVQQKNHKGVEQLLDSGIKTNTKILRRACQNKDTESLRLLLLFGADPNGVDKEGFTPLLAATKVPFIEGAKMLIKYGADPNLSAGPDSETPLAAAVGENKFDLVQLYLTYGGDATLIMANGNIALIKAINRTISSRIVELMLEYDSDPNSKNAEGTTALFQAIQTSRLDLATLLLDHGADPNLPGPKHPLWPSTYQPKFLQLLFSRGADYKKTPGIMELAASIKQKDSISILLEAGVSPNTKKDGVYTPLCSAIRDNSIEIVALLLAKGADPNLMASEYPAWKCVTHHRVHLLPQLVAAGADLHKPKGIIETAVAHNNKDALIYLLEQGVSPNDKSPEGNTPLTTAIREDRADLMDFLIGNGADPGVRGQDWPICMAVKRPAILKKLLPKIPNPRTFKGVMEMAVVANELESIKLLLAAGVSVEDKNGGVFSPLTTAIREDRIEITRFLLYEAGADPNAPGEHLPIIKAIRRCRGNDHEIINMLLDKGADINQMYRGWNAVLQAVENGDNAILRLLVEKGGPVDLQVKDDSGRAVIDVVTERGGEEALTLLFPNGHARQ